MIALGESSFVHLAPECRCPSSHPVIDPINSFRCIQHTGQSIDRGNVQRLNQDATPPGFMNNFHTGDQWISAINQPTTNITIKLSYTNFIFEVRRIVNYNYLVIFYYEYVCVDTSIFILIGILYRTIFWNSTSKSCNFRAISELWRKLHYTSILC